MEKSNLRERVLREFEKLISKSCKNPTDSKKYQQLHIVLLKKYYNALNVSVDYHRHRVQMDIIQDVNAYDPKRINTYLPTVYTNLLFNSLCTFLTNCVERDPKSVGFYAQLLNSFEKNKENLELV